jgi:hypothetical protein
VQHAAMNEEQRLSLQPNRRHTMRPLHRCHAVAGAFVATLLTTVHFLQAQDRVKSNTGFSIAPAGAILLMPFLPPNVTSELAVSRRRLPMKAKGPVRR